jgi:hypothetical protein
VIRPARPAWRPLLDRALVRPLLSGALSLVMVPGLALLLAVYVLPRHLPPPHRAPTPAQLRTITFCAVLVTQVRQPVSCLSAGSPFLGR